MASALPLKTRLWSAASLAPNAGHWLLLVGFGRRERASPSRGSVFLAWTDILCPATLGHIRVAGVQIASLDLQFTVRISP